MVHLVLPLGRIIVGLVSLETPPHTDHCCAITAVLYTVSFNIKYSFLNYYLPSRAYVREPPFDHLD